MVRPLTLLLLFSLLPSLLFAQADYKKFYDEDKLPTVREYFQKGQYTTVIRHCDNALYRGQPSPEWRTLKMQALANLGRYRDATKIAGEVAEKFPEHLSTLLKVHEHYRQTGQEDQLTALLDNINAAARGIPQKDRTSVQMVQLAKAAIALGADPATVLEQYLRPAKQVKKKGRNAPPGLVEAHQAIGEIALSKSDYKMAAEEFRAALAYEPNNPDLRFGLAQAYLPDNRKAGLEELDKVLESFSFHFGALLIRAEYAINFEQYTDAEAWLRVIHGINPAHPEAWALMAVIAELRENDDKKFASFRNNALLAWNKNPEIDHLIGRVLSRNYRFQEGADSQQRSLDFDPDYLPAKLQLALDYLRLGDEAAAWPLAKEVAEADPYNVAAYNLEILEEEMASYETIESDHFIIRLPANEAELYADRAIALLEEARRVLCPKYGVELPEKTLVEFFPNQEDFAIRTFGSLGGAGLIGVCFGSVITMNSPGSLTHGKNNWEATLWHEFAHVVTLTATKNKMPRWLSEGISVFEEIERQPNWGQQMTPRYRKMILEEDALTPIEKMSGAFYNPKSSEHVMFAYYQSMLVVRHIVENFGQEALEKILVDLGEGTLINDAIAAHTKSLAELEADFVAEVTGLAINLGNGVDWSIPTPDQVNPRSPLAVAKYLKGNPKNFWAHQTHTTNLVKAKRWPDAIEAAEAFIEIYPEYVEGLSNGYALKATAHRALKETDKETEILRQLSERSAEAYTAYSQLLSLDLDAKNWAQLLVNANRAMAINPFLKDIHYCRGCACQATGKPKQAIVSFEKLLKLKPSNPSEVRYRLAGLHAETDQPKAKRYVLDALADSPRYRDAYRLLMEID